MSEPLPAHVSLSAPELSDAPALFALINANRDALRPWMPWEPLTRSESDSRAFLQSAAVSRQPSDRQSLYLAGVARRRAGRRLRSALR
ncbi:hypothetical protein JOS77_04635 [Chromobacterium haemolyticum]|nr:hypothetical protein JOS77_04635 [Chromobacterium haemolyticum]